jgi:hypothetical protein
MACLQNRIFNGSGRFTRSVWTAADLSPLWERTESIRFAKVLARPKAPLKRAQSKRSATWPAMFEFEYTP